MTRRSSSRDWLGLSAVVATSWLLATAGSALAHNDPPGCSATGVSIEVRVFRSDGVTGVVGPVSECEAIKYQVVLTKSSAGACAFSGGTLKLTLPNLVVQTISADVPCIGGTTAPCVPGQNDLTSGLFDYTVAVGDIVGGFITATANYTGGVAHDNEPDTPGVAATTPKQTPVVLCTDNNLCTNDICDSTKFGAQACSHTDVVCEDNNACTSNVCNPGTGVCTFPVAVTCTDNNACTTDVCNTTTGLCEFTTSVTCTDNNACTTDVCNTTTGLCEFSTPKTCTDNNACTTDTCNTSTGDCEFSAPKTCTDNNECTTDTCNPATGDCEFSAPKTCTDNNECTTDTCNPATGLCEFSAPKTCTDNNACTTDTCNPATGLCEFSAPTTCTDNNLCTTDTCNPATGLCEFSAPTTCTDNNLCTTDTCNPATGLCEFSAPKTCTDNNLCTTDTCNPATGLCEFSAPTDCNDNNACTIDTCNPATGLCEHSDQSINCNDNDACTIDTCNATSGLCEHAPSNTPECLGLNHFQCYEIKPFAFAKIGNVSVVDRYGAINVTVGTPHPLCAPSDKNGEDPTAQTAPDHLIGYADRSTPVRILNQTVSDQFGTLRLDLLRRTFLMVPTAKSLVSNPPPLANPTTDHFQCYQVRRAAGAPRFVRRSVVAADQFDVSPASHGMDLLRPRSLCVPANKQNEDPTAPTHPQALLCYKAKQRTRFGTLDLFTNNQFGPLRPTITRRLEFCVPATVGVD